MNRRQLFLSTAKAALAAALGGSCLSGTAKAQAGGSAPSGSKVRVIHGDPERASGTVNIDGRYLPPSPPPFAGVIRESARKSTP
jgi:hypothetical protein